MSSLSLICLMPMLVYSIYTALSHPSLLDCTEKIVFRKKTMRNTHKPENELQRYLDRIGLLSSVAPHWFSPGTWSQETVSSYLLSSSAVLLFHFILPGSLEGIGAFGICVCGALGMYNLQFIFLVGIYSLHIIMTPSFQGYLFPNPFFGRSLQTPPPVSTENIFPSLD